MNNLLSEITALPKILGCFVFSSAQGVTGSNMPPIFANNAIKVMGTLLARSKQMSVMAKLNLDSIDIRYNESMLVAKPLNKDTVLVMICEPGVNKSLLNMSVNMLMDDLKGFLSTTRKPVASGGASPAAKPQSDPAIRPILAKIKEALADAIGPIAQPVLEDCVKKWSGNGPQNKARLPNLALLLCMEIDDERLEAGFMEKIKRFL